MRAKSVAITGAILASVYPILSLFGVEVSGEDWAKVTGGITTLVGVIVSLFGESPAQGQIERLRK